jgi:hypothetical protein
MHPKDQQLDCPFLHIFLDNEMTVVSEGEFVNSADIYATYVAYVQSRTKDTASVEAASSPRRFFVQFMALVSHVYGKNGGNPQPQVYHTNKKGKRGYCNLKLKSKSETLRRHLREPSVAGPSTGAISDADLAADIDYSQLVEVKFVSKRVGHGLFAKRDLPPGTVVGEYIGDIINQEEADRRELQYKEENLARTFVTLPGQKKVLDGQTVGGKRINIYADNMPAVANHQKHGYNCILMSFRQPANHYRLFLRTHTALGSIAKGSQLTWDYGGSLGKELSAYGKPE